SSPVDVRLDPLDLMGDHAVHGGSQRTRATLEELPEARLKRGDRVEIERVRERVLSREVMEDGAVGRPAALADERDRGLLVPELQEAIQRRVEDACADIACHAC